LRNETQQKHTIDEAKVAAQSSPVAQGIACACRGLTLLTERLEPILEGTPAKLPFAVFNGFVKAVKVCSTDVYDIDLTLAHVTLRKSLQSTSRPMM